MTIISSEVDSPSTWVRPRKIVSAGTKRTPPPTPTMPPAKPPARQIRTADQLVHERISSIAIATSSAAKSRETARWEMRCWTAVPITTPTTAGIASSSPVTTWTLP